MTVAIQGGSKFYRNLLVEDNDGKTEWLEDIDRSEDNTPGFTSKQREVVDMIGSGDFVLYVDKDGATTLKLLWDA
jgi:hypothetical protein